VEDFFFQNSKGNVLNKVAPEFYMAIMFKKVYINILRGIFVLICPITCSHQRTVPWYFAFDASIFFFPAVRNI
jgi:hypothetical protein